MTTSIFPAHPICQSLDDDDLELLVTHIKDWQINHGSLLKLVRSEEDHTVLSRPIGVTLFPSLFPRNCFEEALQLQPIYNQLYCAVAEDEEWLASVLKDLIEHDKLTSILWDIHLKAKQHACTPSGRLQDLTLGLFRSDYMLHVDTVSKEIWPKQVEFNTFSIAGGSHGNRASKMHNHLRNIEMYQLSPKSQHKRIQESSFPSNNTIQSMASALASAHIAYGPPTHDTVAKTCILMIVQPYNVNIADERPIEYALWEHDPVIPMYRIELREIDTSTTLTRNGALLYHPPSRRSLPPLEVSTVYLRAGLDPQEYDDTGIAARLRLECSRAIKCPSILGHLATFKKVQQALAAPGALARFLPPASAARLAATFAPMYPLDASDAGRTGRALATDAATARNHVLKPSLEGGGHNVYGAAIPGFLKKLPRAQWASYVLMEKIAAPTQWNLMMAPRGPYVGETLTELGVFGACLWRRTESGGAEMVMNENAGWSLKTKPEGVDEMSVVKGYGCFDSPFLY